MPSHLINRAIELNATQQKGDGSESEAPSFHLLFTPFSGCDFQTGSFFTAQLFHHSHYLIGFTEDPSLSPRVPLGQALTVQHAIRL